jgi:hypothetical protein
VGYLVYDGTTRIQLDDRVLAHLEIIMIIKFRRREGFPLRWRDSANDGQGRNMVWLDPSMPLRLHLDSPKAAPTNREWIEQMAEAASTNHGLELLDEQGNPVVGTLSLHP